MGVTNLSLLAQKCLSLVTSEEGSLKISSVAANIAKLRIRKRQVCYPFKYWNLTSSIFEISENWWIRVVERDLRGHTVQSKAAYINLSFLKQIFQFVWLLKTNTFWVIRVTFEKPHLPGLFLLVKPHCKGMEYVIEIGQESLRNGKMERKGQEGEIQPNA